MSFIRTLRAFVSALLVLCAITPTIAKPAVFSDFSYRVAVERAREQKKLVVIDGMASWCGPCKAMDRATWTNKTLAAWMAENCIAVQFDVDHDPQAAKKFAVRSMPTVIVYVAGNEAGRKVGYLDAKEMLTWLKQVQKKAGLGESNDAERGVDKGKGVQGGDDDGSKNVSGDEKLLADARALAAKDKHQEAARAYAVLWKSLSKSSIPDSKMMTEAAADMRLLVKNFPGAKKSFVELRDAAAPKPRDPLMILPGDLLTWATLNGVLGEGDKTLAWFDEAQSNPAAKSYVLKIDRELGPELVKAKRWTQLSWLVKVALAAGDVRTEHVEWLEAAGRAGEGDAALLTEARAKAV